ncbi:MAG: hypothetical protein IT364_05000 [Candidatus Hydrogenedentes bacterium]|nr:hypothetical protein [Candidatus Hydrogenedentota bacterium]
MKRKNGMGVLLLALALAAWGACAQVTQTQGETEVTPPSEDGVSVNFRGVTLDDFLEFLSEKAGFVINREVQVSGEVDVSSHRPLNRDELFDLLVTVLNSKGYTALRNDRTLTIVRREDALKRDIPVRASSEPEAIPRNDEMVTQIIPVRHAEAKQLLENLQPLLPEYANASANESSNAIVITDVQTNVRRMAEIVNALDTSISSISTVRVFTLTASDAEDVANVINELFESEDSGSSGGGASARNQRFGGPPGFPMPGGGGPGADAEDSSAAREAVSRVVAVEDERTNSVVVAAPAEIMETVAGIIDDLEASEGVQNEVRVFPLKYADAEHTAELVTNLFANELQSSSSSSTGVAIPSFGGGRMGPGGGPGGMPGSMGGTRQSSLSSEQALVVAEADVRTNSVVVNAPSVYMETIASMIDDLDKNPAKKRKVFVYKLENADPEDVASIVSGMFSESSSSGTSSTARSSNSTQRSTGSTSSSSSSSSSQRSSSSGNSQMQF